VWQQARYAWAPSQNATQFMSAVNQSHGAWVFALREENLRCPSPTQDPTQVLFVVGVFSSACTFLAIPEISCKLLY